MLKPIFPYLEYAANYEYYKTVLCKNQDLPELNCNGSCALAQKIKEAKSKSLPPFAPPVTNLDITEYPISTLNQEHFDFVEDDSIGIQNPNVIGSPSSFVHDWFEPPRA